MPSGFEKSKKMFGKKSAPLSLFILTMLRCYSNYTKRYISNFNRVITFTLLHAYTRKGKIIGTSYYSFVDLNMADRCPNEIFFSPFFFRNMYLQQAFVPPEKTQYFFSFLWFIITHSRHTLKNVNF